MKVYEGNFFKDLAAKLAAKGYAIYAPVKVKDYFLFRRVDTDEVEIPEDYSNTLKPAKEIVFPQNEVLIKYGEWIEEVPADEEKKVVLAVRPCDAKGIALLDKVFLEDFVDPYYKVRRDNTILIGLACKKAGEYCFCTSVGLSPFGKEGLDVIVYDLDGKYLVEAVSEKGSDALADLELREASDDEVAMKEEIERQVLESFTRKLELDGLKELMRANFESEYWMEVAMNCASCGACTYLCPTCFCFDMLDEGEARGFRYRCWDSCQFPLYTLESSSHNPRSQKWQRLRNRFYDKFLYMVERKGEVYCVGCGRCIEKCPVGIDIVEVLSGLKEVEA